MEEESLTPEEQIAYLKGRVVVLREVIQNLQIRLSKADREMVLLRRGSGLVPNNGF